MSLRKKRVLVAVFALLLGMLAVKIALPCKVYHYEGSYTFAEGEVTDGIAVYSGIVLPPGVYHIELDFEADMDLIGMCTARDGTVISGGLRTNGEHLYGGNTRTGFDMWLFESSEDMQIVVSYGGKGQLATGDLTIRETNQLWTMLLVILSGAAALIAAVIYFREQERKHGVDVHKRQVIFFVSLIALFATLPCLYNGLLGGADLTYHLQRIEGCKDGILGGQFPVRLEPKWIFGYGYANAVFYCNAFLYLPALLRLAGFSVMTSYNIYCVALGLATAWIAWYCFAKIFRDDRIGLVCSALYTLSSFRLYKLYECGAVGESSAYPFLPLVFYGLYRVFSENPKEKSYKTAWLPVALGYAGIIQTHVLTCEITAFLTIVICVVFIRKIFCFNTFLELVKGALGALALGMWYLIPFADYYVTQDVHIKHVSARTIQEMGLRVIQIVAGRQVQEYDAIGVGPALLLGLCVFVVLLLGGFLRGRRKELVNLGIVCAVLGLLMMIMSLHIFPWNAIQNVNALSASLVSSLQFPNRFLGWGTLFLVAVSGLVLWYLRDKRQSLFLLGSAVAVAGIVITYQYQMNWDMIKRSTYQLYNEEGMGFGYISGGEYLIQGTDKSLLTFRGAQAGEGVELNDYQKRYLRVEMNCRKEGDGEGYVDLPLLYYKGYRACEKGTGRTLEVCDGENHVVRVILPEGFGGDVLVRFVSPFYWRIGEIISVAALIYIVVWCWSGKYVKRQNEG